MVAPRERAAIGMLNLGETIKMTGNNIDCRYGRTAPYTAVSFTGSYGLRRTVSRIRKVPSRRPYGYGTVTVYP